MWKPAFFGAKALIAAAAVLALTPSDSFAQHRGGGGFGGGWGGGGWGFGGGIRGGGFYGGYGWGGPGWGYGSYYGYPGYYGGGYYSPYYDSQPYYYSQPVVPYYQDAPVALAPSTNLSNYPPQQTMADNSAEVEVRVPADAQVWFDSTPTQQKGTDRLFHTPPLTSGQRYTYQLRATWMANGAPVTQTRQVQVEAGKRATVDFTKGEPGK